MTDELDELARIIRYYTGINISSEPDFESELWLFLNKLESLKDQECTKARIDELKQIEPPKQFEDYASLMGSEHCTVCGFNAIKFREHITDRIAELSNKENK